MKKIIIGLIGFLCIGTFFPLKTNAEEKDLANLSMNTVYIAGHRGGYENDVNDNAPENTVANLYNAASKGIDLAETDISITKDGVFIMFHDPTLERETNGTGLTAELTYAEILKLKKRFRDGSISNERVATFDQFLKASKDRIYLKIDLKEGVKEHFDEVIEIVRKNKMLKQVVFRVLYSDKKLYEKYINKEWYVPTLFMFKLGKKSQVDYVQSKFCSKFLEVKLKNCEKPLTNDKIEMIKYAVSKGAFVETHDYGNIKDLIKLGVRMLHTKKPLKQMAIAQSLGIHK
jgi:glycerophosphoryl diester phosphodiesterase